MTASDTAKWVSIIFAEKAPGANYKTMVDPKMLSSSSTSAQYKYMYTHRISEL